MKQKIVLIDNFEPTQNQIKTVLEEKGFHVEIFPDIESAKPFIEKNDPDLILSDLIRHNNLGGAETQINYLTEKKLKFAFWISPNQDQKDPISLFIDGLPENYRTKYSQENSLNQNQVDVLIENYNDNKSSTVGFLNGLTLKNILGFLNKDN